MDGNGQVNFFDIISTNSRNSTELQDNVYLTVVFSTWNWTKWLFSYLWFQVLFYPLFRFSDGPILIPNAYQSYQYLKTWQNIFHIVLWMSETILYFLAMKFVTEIRIIVDLSLLYGFWPAFRQLFIISSSFENVTDDSEVMIHSA